MEPTIVEEEFNISADYVTHSIYTLLKNMGVADEWINLLNFLILIAATLLVVFCLQKLVHYALTFILKKVHEITRFSLFNHLKENRLPRFLGLTISYAFLINVLPTVLEGYPKWIKPAVKMADIYMVLLIIWVIMAIIKSFVNLLQEKPTFRQKPMQSYIQVIQIILYIIGAVAVFSILTGKSAAVFFTAMGAASAVLMLIFKDSILGLAGSIQISLNQMVMVGDWITMNKFGADGTVEEINLTTVKIRNFDNTITTIPTYSMIADSFQNWRGMQESGGRRIKRPLYVKQSSIRPMTDQELDKFAETDALKEYIRSKRQIFTDFNKKLNLKNSLLEGNRITNCDLFINYVVWYLHQHPGIHQGMTIMARQMEPTTEGLPIQIYAFTNKTALLEYEQIMGEIFNHFIISMSAFGLIIFETSAGTDSYNVVMNQPTATHEQKKASI